jgi:hypothetical protein
MNLKVSGNYKGEQQRQLRLIQCAFYPLLQGDRSYEALSTFILTQAAAYKTTKAEASPSFESVGKDTLAILPQVEVH